MSRFAIGALATACWVALNGCGLGGKWEVVSVEPEQAKETFPFTTITFDEGKTYTATQVVEDDEDEETVIGQYGWDGMQLAITPKDGVTRTYWGSLQRGNKLVLKATHRSVKIKVVLKKENESAKQ